MGLLIMLKPEANTFEEFWALCPKKIGKMIAQAKWNAIVSPSGLRTRTTDRDSGMWINLTLQATPQELVEGMKRYRETQFDKQTYKLKDEGKYTCHPASWLNQGRWED